MECIRLGKTCDLAISPTTLKKIHSERVRLRKEVREMRTKLLRLERQLEFVEDKEEELATTEWRNILELEGDERKVQEVVTSDLLFDVSAEQFALPEGFDWSAFPASHETPVEAPGSSQGS